MVWKNMQFLFSFGMEVSANYVKHSRCALAVQMFAKQY